MTGGLPWLLGLLALLLRGPSPAAARWFSEEASLSWSSRGASSNGSGGDTDAALLLAFRDSFANGNATLASWAGGDPCAGGWEGVTCDAAGGVTKIVLPGKGLQGSLPTVPLPAGLRVLILSNNQLSGKLPEGFRWPAALYELALDGNQLTGSIPAAWHPPESLEFLWLMDNELRGKMLGWKDRPGLQVFVFPGNFELCGRLPETPQYSAFEGRNYEPELPEGASKPTGYHVKIAKRALAMQVKCLRRRKCSCSKGVSAMIGGLKKGPAPEGEGRNLGRIFAVRLTEQLQKLA